MSVEINQTTETIIFYHASSSILNKLPNGIKTIIIILFDDDETLNLPLTVERIYIAKVSQLEEFDITHLKIPFGCSIEEFENTPRLSIKNNYIINKFSLVVEHGLDIGLFRTNTQIITRQYSDNTFEESYEIRLKKVGDKINFTYTV
jgi:hypothetical protein